MKLEINLLQFFASVGKNIENDFDKKGFWKM